MIHDQSVQKDEGNYHPKSIDIYKAKKRNKLLDH